MLHVHVFPRQSPCGVPPFPMYPPIAPRPSW
ncbi:unnamed protein product [Acanthoscelides obtectus]|uniref:Uncharacterized protein n=1 Tax=Acanthoscelides obtectus TaxID=200917 RepID=A0A9P0QGU8_ACAOB|nr:unnamed protein product [Acanthoscelides obtectus]CAK1682429.1 hypothetical protein AOBTE_LOCUS33622 [Acanthoscelides obtectus]